MPDREKVIKGLQEAVDWLSTETSLTVVDQWVVRDALVLLKAQEPVEPKKVIRYIDFDGEGHPYNPETYDCGACGNELPFKANYCPVCGRAVKWDD